MDNLGNVVSPIIDSVLQTDNDWGKDSNGNTPSVASIEYKVNYGDTWLKELVITHHQDLQGAGVLGSLALTNNGTSMNILETIGLDNNDNSILNVSINDNNDSLLTSDIISGKIKLAYTKPGVSERLTNWLGFEIEEYSDNDAKTVTLHNSNPALPTISNLTFTEGNVNQNNFDGTLSWDTTGVNIVEYVVETASSSDSTNWTKAIEPNPTTSPVSISGLSFNTDHYFRVKAKTYEFGDYKVSSLVRNNNSFTFTLSSDNKSSEQLSVPVITASWNEVTGAKKYKLEVSKNENFNTIYGIREFSNPPTDPLPTNLELDYLVNPNVPDTNKYFEASTTYYIRVKADNTDDNSGYNFTSNQVTVTTKSSTPTSLSISFDRTDRILPALSANWSNIGEADEYRLRLYHKVADFDDAGEEIFLEDKWEPFTVNNDPDNVRIEVGNPLDEPTTNSISNVTKYQIYQADGSTLNTDRSFISDDAVVNPGGDGNAVDLKIVDFAFAVKALHKRTDGSEVFFDLYPTYDDDENNMNFSPVTVSNPPSIPSTGEDPNRIFQPTITFSTAPTVTEPEGEVDFKVEFNANIADADKYRILVSKNNQFPVDNTDIKAGLNSSPATDFGDFSPEANTFYYVKYEAGITNDNEVKYYEKVTGNETVYLSLADAPSFTLAPLHGGNQLQLSNPIDQTNQPTNGITFDYNNGFQLKAYDTTLNGDNQNGYDSSWTTIPGPQSTSTGGDSIWIYGAVPVVNDYGSDPLVQNLQANTAYKFRARVETTPIGTGITGGGYSPYSDEVVMMTLPAYFSPPSFNTSSTSHSTTKIPLTITKITGPSK